MLDTKEIFQNKVFLLNAVSLLFLGVFFVFLYAVFEPNLFSDFLVIYFNQRDNSTLIGSLNKVAEIGYFGFFVFLLNNFLLFCFFKKEKEFQIVVSLTTFLVSLFLILLEISLYLQV